MGKSASRHLERFRSQGFFRSIKYFLAVALERAGVEVYDSFVLEPRPAAEFKARSGHCHHVLSGIEEFTQNDLKRLVEYGGNALLEDYRLSFSRGDLCCITRLNGVLASACWARDTVNPLPDNDQRCVLIERCITLPDSRGRGAYPRTLGFLAKWLRCHGFKGRSLEVFIQCARFNYASRKGIRKVGFSRVMSTVRVRSWAWHLRIQA